MPPIDPLTALRALLTNQPPSLSVTAHSLAERFVGTTEVPGKVANPAILAMLRLDATWPGGDEVPWCSAFVNYICWLLRLPRSKSLRARSWLDVGEPVDWEYAKKGFDVVVLARGGGNQPGPDVIDAPGHVGFFAGDEHIEDRDEDIYILGGNQNNGVNVSVYPVGRLLGIRRLYG